MTGWTENTVTLDTQYMFSKGENTYKFPRKVFNPDATQQQVYDTFNPLVNEFIGMPGRNCMLLAYGQTGTGKTHTIFGKKEA
jgi:DNA replication protein DnaC